MTAGDPVELLELLEADGGAVSVLDGQLVFSNLPPWARLVSRASWQLLAAVLQGTEGRWYGYKDSAGKARSKTLRHVWMRCDACGEGVIREKSAGAKKCVITPNCEGKHQP